MAVLKNRTGFRGEMLPWQNASGKYFLVVVVKATYRISSAGAEVAEVQDDVNGADEYSGAPGLSSLKCASDFAFSKPGTDVGVCGSAYAPAGTEVDRMYVELAVASFRKRLVVFGDRRWKHGPEGLSISTPVRFARMPLCYERAFGGKGEERNPVGIGFYAAKPGPGSPLPNIEAPESLITRWSDRPAPQGFGFVCGDWLPRKKFAGTYDRTWQEEQFPLPPADFDEKYFLAAHPDLQFTPHLRGDEPIALAGTTPTGTIAFSLPGTTVGLSVHFRRGRPIRTISALDTLTLFPDESKFYMVWRYAIPCPSKILDVEEVTAFSLRLSTIQRLLRDTRAAR